MQSDELIECLKDAQKRHGAALPVIMVTRSGTGEIDRVEVVLDTVAGCDEILLLEGE